MPPKHKRKVDATRSVTDSPSTSPKSTTLAPRAKTEFSLEVEALKSAIRKKSDWKEKLKNPVIKSRYHEEAVAQGANPDAVKVALEELELFEVDESRFDFDEIVSNNCILHADGVVPTVLQKTLEKHLDTLGEEVIDFHPGSDDKVQDLIHPSLYPYIKGESVTYKSLQSSTTKSEQKKKSSKKGVKQVSKKKTSKKYGSRMQDDDDDEEMDEDYDNNNEHEDEDFEYEDRWGRAIEKSKYQWLPAIYSIDKKNKVKITSYINNLDRSEHPEIYEDCEKIFEHLLPMIERCMHNAMFPFRDDPEVEYRHCEEEEYEIVRPREYQVITKACNYILKPGQTYEGNWHVEGMTHERILVSALYYYSSSPFLEDSGLAFRADAGYNEDHGPGDTRQWERSVNLGTIRTNEGRTIVFSNEFQHRVTRLENTHPTDIATRKILCFFVVDPEHPIVSSKDVPPQQWDKNRKKLTILLLCILRRLKITTANRKFPKDVMKHIMKYAKVGFTEKEAHKHRKELMKERKFFVDEMNREMERSFSLCEH